MENFGSNSSDRSTNIFKSNDLHAFPRLPRRAGAGRRFSLHRFRKHHRLLSDIGISHGNGTHLRASLRSQTVEASRPDAPADCSPPSLLFHSHLFHVAQHAQNPLMVRSGPPDLFRRSHFHTLLHPRPLLSLSSPSSPNLPPNAEHYAAAHVLLCHLCSPPRAFEFPSRREAPAGNFRRRYCHGLD